MVKFQNFFKKFIMFFVFAFILLISSFIYWAVGNSLPKYSKLKTITVKSIATSEPSNSLRILSYNVAHGQGVKILPTDWRDKKTTVFQLKQIVSVLRRADADIVLLQEIDIDANRTQHINQVKLLARESRYPHYAYATVWDKNYVPFPFWPIKHHIGRVKSANCVLSKFPLTDHERIIFDKPHNNPFWYNWGYLDRGLQKVVVQVGHKKINIVNIHLEAWDIEARQQQIKISLNLIEHLEGPVILGGDFNALPPEASKKKGFADEPEISFEGDKTIHLIRNRFKEYSQAISDKTYLKNELFCATFPSNDATRKLDHIFAFNGVEFTSGRIMHEAGTASDHLPILAIAEIK